MAISCRPLELVLTRSDLRLPPNAYIPISLAKGTANGNTQRTYSGTYALIDGSSASLLAWAMRSSKVSRDMESFSMNG